MAEDLTDDSVDLPDDAATLEDGTPPKAKSARSWLALIKRAQKVFETWQKKADSLDRLYANLERLSNTVRDREYQIFWANVQVIGPSIYSRPPVPVVVPAFRDQRELPRQSSELLERCAVTTFRLEDIDSVMRLLRDDMIRVGRGVPWLRYSTEDDYQCVCIDHVDRQDFVHDPARKWKEVDWGAKRSWLTRAQARKRFYATSGNEYKQATYAVRKDDNDITDGQLKAGFWELWSKSANKVIWVAEGCENVLDEGPPHLDLEGFFPFPKPAFSTLQPGSLVPVPDMLFYKDQLEEINEITARVAALTQSLKLKGFYPAGAGEIGDAVEAAIKSTTDNAVLIPVSNWSMFGGGAAKDMIVWLPIEMVVETITALVELRKQLIDDVYQITGLSDIMRGDTDAQETLGAQQIKAQYGSIRVHDRQSELVRVARDITSIACEIMAENFSADTLLDMSQMQVPSNAEIAKQVGPIKKEFAALAKELEAAKQDPEVQQAAQKNPDAAKQVMEAAQQKAQGLEQQIQQLEQTVTIEQIVAFLRDNRMRPFTLDIETDSTIAPDEAAQQQRATEFTTAIGTYLGQAIPLVESVPQTAPVAAAFLKFIASQFRVGREIEGTIDKFADQMAQMGDQPKGPTPAQQQMQLDQTKMEMQAQLDKANMTIEQQKGALAAQKQQFDIELATANLRLNQQKITSDAQIANDANAIEATKHAGIEETKRQQSALDALVQIEVAEIDAKAANDGQMLAAQLEGEADLRQNAHEQVMQANEIEANSAAQQAAGTSPAPAQPTPAPAPAPAAPQQAAGPSALGMLGDILSKLSEQNQMIAQALTAPKRVVRDGNGRPIGVETVMN
jgi:hypothetical protein